MRLSAESLGTRTLFAELVASLPDDTRRQFATRVAARLDAIDAARKDGDTHARCAIAREHVAKVLKDA